MSVHNILRIQYIIKGRMHILKGALVRNKDIIPNSESLLIENWYETEISSTARYKTKPNAIPTEETRNEDTFSRVVITIKVSV